VGSSWGDDGRPPRWLGILLLVILGAVTGVVITMLLLLTAAVDR
jgi:hypothetical protein